MNGHQEKLNIYYNGSDELDFTNTKIKGSLFINNANLKFAGQGEVIGNIISGGSKIDISGNGVLNGQYIIAPYADFTLSNKQIKGMVIVKSIAASGNTVINVGEPFIPLPTIPSETETVQPNIPDLPKFVIETDLKEL